jgi:hypothetical protein
MGTNVRRIRRNPVITRLDRLKSIASAGRSFGRDGEFFRLLHNEKIPKNDLERRNEIWVGVGENQRTSGCGNRVSLKLVTKRVEIQNRLLMIGI